MILQVLRFSFRYKLYHQPLVLSIYCIAFPFHILNISSPFFSFVCVYRAKVFEIFKQYHAVNKNSDLAIHKKRVACRLPCLQISSNFITMIMKRMGASTTIELVLLSQIIAFRYAGILLI